MARPTKATKQEKRLTFRATEAEAAALLKRAEAARLSLSAFMRAALIEKPTGRTTAPRQRKPAADVQALAALMGQLGKIGGNLNQIAHRLNAGQPVGAAAVNAELTELKRLRAEVLAAIERG